MSSSSILEIDIDKVDEIIKSPLLFTKQLFTFDENTNFADLVSQITTYIQAEPSNKSTVEQILGVFSIFRPHQEDILTKLENSLSVKHVSKLWCLTNFFIHNITPFIPSIKWQKYPLLELIKGDKLKEIQEIVLKEPEFDYSQTFHIKNVLNRVDDEVNLLDVAAFYGSVQTFKYFAINNAPFSEMVCRMAILGGSTEIIHFLEQDHADDFKDEKCLTMSIVAHRYSITDWLILNYGHKLEEAIDSYSSFNYIVFAAIEQAGLLSDQKNKVRVAHAAAKAGDLPVIRYLIEKQNLDVESRADTSEKETILHSALLGSNLTLVKYLVETQKADVNAKCYTGWTSMHKACEGGCLDIVKYLIEEQKLDKDARDDDDYTAFHNACLFGHLDIVKYLVEQKVHKVVKDNNGYTPYNYARPHIKKYLRTVGVKNSLRKDPFWFMSHIYNDQESQSSDQSSDDLQNQYSYDDDESGDSESESGDTESESSDIESGDKSDGDKRDDK